MTEGGFILIIAAVTILTIILILPNLFRGKTDTKIESPVPPSLLHTVAEPPPSDGSIEFFSWKETKRYWRCRNCEIENSREADCCPLCGQPRR